MDRYSEECFYDIHGNLLSRGGTKPGADLRFSVTPDLNGDGVVNEQDLHRMELGSEDGIQDMNGDGEVNIADILHQVYNGRRLAPLEDPPGDNQLPDWEQDDFGNTVQTPDGQTMAYDDWGRLEHYGKDGVNDHHIAFDVTGPHGNILTIFWCACALWRRCSSLSYREYARSSRLARERNHFQKMPAYFRADPDGKRFATWNEDQPGTTQYTVFNESGKPLAVYQWDGFDFTLKKEHYYMGSRHIASDIWDAQAGCPQRIYLHADHLGSARQYSDDTGVFIGFKDYHVFGDEWDKDLTCLPIATDFTGHQTMGGTDLIWMQARTYSPHYGRFLEPDPLQWESNRLRRPWSLNLFNYARFNPLKFMDPVGFQEKESDPAQPIRDARDIISREFKEAPAKGGSKLLIAIVETIKDLMPVKKIAKKPYKALTGSPDQYWIGFEEEIHKDLDEWAKDQIPPAARNRIFDEDPSTIDADDGQSAGLDEEPKGSQPNTSAEPRDAAVNPQTYTSPETDTVGNASPESPRPYFKDQDEFRQWMEESHPERINDRP